MEGDLGMDGLFTQELIGAPEVEGTNPDMVVIDPVMEETNQEVEDTDLEEVEEDPVVVEEDLEEAAEDLEEEEEDMAVVEDMEVADVVVAVVDVKIKTVAFFIPYLQTVLFHTIFQPSNFFDSILFVLVEAFVKRIVCGQLVCRKNQ